MCTCIYAPMWVYMNHLSEDALNLDSFKFELEVAVSHRKILLCSYSPLLPNQV